MQAKYNYLENQSENKQLGPVNWCSTENSGCTSGFDLKIISVQPGDNVKFSLGKTELNEVKIQVEIPEE